MFSNFRGNNLQTLSHILSLFDGSPEDKCNKVILLDKTLRKYDIPLKGYSLPILGISASATDDYEAFAKILKETDTILKKQSGFGSFSLVYAVRSMISVSLVTSSYIEYFDENSDKIIETTNNIALNIILIMQIVAACAASSQLLQANSNIE